MLKRLLPLLPAILVVVMGCQGNPTIPGTDFDEQATPVRAADTGSGHQCLGFWSLSVDTESLSITALPARSADLHLNITGVLNTTMGVSAAAVPSESDPPNGLFAFDITLKHPFGTKPQLAGFDVKGILMTPGTLAIGTLKFADWDETRLENADGYTRWWNPTEFTQSGMFGYTQGVLANSPASSLTATVNPYKYFADALEATDTMGPVHNTAMDADTGRGVFTAGSSNARRYLIRFPMNPGPQVVYGYAVDASWAAPSPNPPAAVPDDFPLNANQAEPYDVVVVPTANTLFYDSESGMKGGVLRLATNVHDWQGQSAADIAGQVSAVRAYAPDLFSGAVDAVMVGATPIKAQYSIDLTGKAVPSQPGTAVVAVRAESSDGQTYDQGLGYPAAISSAISSWQALTVDIVDPECEADMNNSMLEAEPIEPGDQIADTMCEGLDTEDWYFFEIAPGFRLEGEIRWYEDAEKAKMELYDSQAQLLDQSSLTGGGTVKIELDPLDLVPDTYYIHLEVDTFTPSGTGAMVYLLQSDFNIVDSIPDNPVDITPWNLDCDAIWVKKYGDYAFLAGLVGYWVYDVSDYGDSVFVSRIYDKCGSEPAFYYPYMYSWEDPSASPAGIDMVDFTDPAAPELTEDAVVVNDGVADITMNSQYLYIAAGTGLDWRVSIYDYLVNPAAPIWVSDFAIDEKPVDLEVIDPDGPDTALVVLFDGHIRVFVVEDPLDVTPNGLVTTGAGTEYKDLAISGWYLVHSYVQPGPVHGVSILSYSPATQLDVHGHAVQPGDGIYVSAQGTTCYVADGTEGITVIDFSSPENPTVESSEYTLSIPVSLDADGDILVSVSEHAGFSVYDLSIPVNPILMTFAQCVNAPVTGAFIGDYGIFCQIDGPFTALTYLDNTDVLQPVVAVSWPISGPFDSIAVQGDVVAIGSSQGGAFGLLDGGSMPDFLPIYGDNYGIDVLSLALTDTRCYVSLLNGLIHVYDISSFPTVTPLAPVMVPWPAWHLALKGSYMYGSNGLDLLVFSLSNIDAPLVVNSLPMAHNINELKVRGDYLYMLTSDTLEVLDISTGNAPGVVGSVVLPYAPNMKFMAIDSQNAYVADDVSPTVAVNLWPPNDPQVFGEVTTPCPDFPNSGLLVNNGILYEMHTGIGLKIYDLY